MIFAALTVIVLLAWWYTAVSHQFIDWFPYPSAARWTLGFIAMILILAGMGMHSGSGYTDWDGRSNPIVSD